MENQKVVYLGSKFKEYLEKPYETPATAVSPTFNRREFKNKDRQRMNSSNRGSHYKKFLGHIQGIIEENMNILKDESLTTEERNKYTTEISKALTLKRLVDDEYDRSADVSIDDRYQYNQVWGICFASGPKVDTLPLLEVNSFDNKSKEHYSVYCTTDKLAEFLSLLSGGDVDSIKDGIESNMRKAIEEGRYSEMYGTYEIYSQSILGSNMPTEAKDPSFMVGVCPELDQLFMGFKEKIKEDKGIVVHGKKILNLVHEDDLTFLLSLYIIMILQELQIYLLDLIITDICDFKGLYSNNSEKCSSYPYAGGFGIISSRSNGMLVVQNSIHYNDTEHPEYNGRIEALYSNYLIKGTCNRSMQITVADYCNFEWATAFIKSDFVASEKKHCISVLTRKEYI